MKTARLELASKSDIDKALAIDAPKASTNTKSYITDNYLNYYILVNTWLYMIRQYSAYGWTRLLTLIISEGLLSLIRRASSAADEVVTTGSISGGIFSMLYRDVITTLKGTVITPQSGEKTINVDPVATMLMILRYPKRLSPVGNDIIQTDSIRDFLNVENRSKMWSRNGYSHYFVTWMADEMQTMLNWDALCDQLDEVRSDRYLIDFTSGSSLTTNASLGAKLVELSKVYPEYFRSPFGIPYAGIYPQVEEESWGKRPEPKRLVKVMAVPKSYKASRIIAPEAVYNQGRAHVAFTVCDRFTPDGFPIHNQEINQLLALYGSLHEWDPENNLNSLATIDLSHASDTITKLLFWNIFPRRFAEIIYSMLPTHYLVDGKERLMHQMSTAGNSLTFWLEGITFLCLSRVATKIYSLYAKEETISSVHICDRDITVPSVYGDDIVVDSRVYDTLVDVGTALGFQINESKSFQHGPYRESCGAEYMGGIDVSSYYFPRFPLEGKVGSLTLRYRRDSFTGDLTDTLTSMVSLQKRLFNVSFEASNFLRVFIEDCFPKMTTSIQGELTSDCWDYEDTYANRYSPHPKEITINGKKIRREPDRRAKFAPSVKFEVKNGIEKIPPLHIRLFELHKYNEFLRYGPRYEDPLLELLGISSPPIKVEAVFGTPKVIWSLREVEYDW